MSHSTLSLACLMHSSPPITLPFLHSRPFLIPSFYHFSIPSFPHSSIPHSHLLHGMRYLNSAPRQGLNNNPHVSEQGQLLSVGEIQIADCQPRRHRLLRFLVSLPEEMTGTGRMCVRRRDTTPSLLFHPCYCADGSPSLPPSLTPSLPPSLPPSFLPHPSLPSSLPPPSPQRWWWSYPKA